jgi:hypothetical protein
MIFLVFCNKKPTDRLTLPGALWLRHSLASASGLKKRKKKRKRKEKKDLFDRPDSEDILSSEGDLGTEHLYDVSSESEREEDPPHCPHCDQVEPWCLGGDVGFCRFRARDSVIALSGHRVLAGYCCEGHIQEEGEQCGGCGGEVGPPRC